MNDLLKIWSETLASRMDEIDYEGKRNLLKDYLEKAYQLGQRDREFTRVDEKYPIKEITRNP